MSSLHRLPQPEAAAGAAAAALPAQALAERSLALVDRPLGEARSILPQCYTDPGFFELEVERVFRRSWICVGRESSIPASGDYFCADYFGDKLVVVRGEDGRVRALSPVCSHRSALVAEGAANASRFQCPYHKWTYDLRGRFVSSPLLKCAPAAGESFDLPRFRCETWLGFIMVNLDGAAESFATRMAPLAGDIAAWGIERMVPLAEPVVFEAEYNWKIVCDNQGESYHLIGPHAQSVLPYMDPRDSVFTSDLRTHAKSWFPSHSGVVGPVFGDRRPGIPADFNGTWSYNVFPNLLFVVTDDFVIWQHQKIVGHDRFRLELWVLGDPEIRDDPAMQRAVRDVRDGVVTVEGEDQSSFRSVWQGVQALSARPGPFAGSEQGTWHWQRWLCAAVAAAEA